MLMKVKIVPYNSLKPKQSLQDLDNASKGDAKSQIEMLDQLQNYISLFQPTQSKQNEHLRRKSLIQRQIEFGLTFEGQRYFDQTNLQTLDLNKTLEQL